MVCQSFIKIWLSISSDEVKLFKQSSVSVNSTQEDHMTNFVHWVVENVDHNIRTLTGKGTFHGMGIIEISPSKLKYDAIKRLKHNKKVDLSATSVKITLYIGPSFHGLSKVKLRPINNLTLQTIHAPEGNLDLLWHASWFFAPRNNHRPNWSGYMMHVTSQATTAYESASVKFFPILDLNPSDQTCIYSTLLFVIEEAKKLNITSLCNYF